MSTLGRLAAAIHPAPRLLEEAPAVPELVQGLQNVLGLREETVGQRLRHGAAEGASLRREDGESRLSAAALDLLTQPPSQRRMRPDASRVASCSSA